MTSEHNDRRRRQRRRHPRVRLIALAVLAALLGAASLARCGEEPRRPAATTETRPTDAGAAIATSPEAPADSARPQRSEVSAGTAAISSSDDPRYGALRLHAAWKASGLPAVGAQIRVGIAAGYIKPRIVKLDPAGNATLTRLVPGIYHVLYNLNTAEIVPVIAGQIREIDWSLPASPSVHGVVRDARTGGAIIGAVVRCADDAEILRGEAITDADGAYLIDGLPLNVHVSAVADGRRCSIYASLLNPGERRRIDLELPVAPARIAPALAGTFNVKIEEAGGAPVAGAGVSLTVTQPAADGRGHLDCGRASGNTTDAFGALRFTGVAPGELLVTVFADGHAPARRSASLASGDEVTEHITLPKPSVVVGCIRDAAGQPVPGAVVSVTFGDNGLVGAATTGVDGRYRIAGLPTELITLEVHCPTRGQATEQRSVTTGETIEWSPTLGAGAQLQGQLIDASRSPLAGWHVQGRMGTGASTTLCFTDADGMFTLSNCSGTTVDVRVAPHSDFFTIPV